MDAGGSIEEFKQFVKFAQESAHMVVSTDKIVEELTKNKNPSSSPAKFPKLYYKLELVDANEKIELTADDGLEKAYQLDP